MKQSSCLDSKFSLFDQKEIPHTWTLPPQHCTTFSPDPLRMEFILSTRDFPNQFHEEFEGLQRQGELSHVSGTTVEYLISTQEEHWLYDLLFTIICSTLPTFLYFVFFFLIAQCDNLSQLFKAVIWKCITNTDGHLSRLQQLWNNGRRKTMAFIALFLLSKKHLENGQSGKCFT